MNERHRAEDVHDDNYANDQRYTRVQPILEENVAAIWHLVAWVAMCIHTVIDGVGDDACHGDQVYNGVADDNIPLQSLLTHSVLHGILVDVCDLAH